MNNTTQRIVTGLFLGASFMGIYSFLPPYILTIILAIIGGLIIEVELRKLGVRLLAPLYPVIPIILLCKLNQTPEYHHLVLLTVMITFMFDTGSYIIGSSIGIHRIAPSISPKKTWEGLFGGLLFCFATTYGLFWYYSIDQSLQFINIFTVTFSICAFLGDLFVSYLKRRVNLKDTGSLLPGHGGLLDRLDSILFTVTFIYLLRNYLLIS